MKKGDSRKKTGFTIIEVALVLAIAGLIFLMVFIALPSLQRSQRDSRRRDDILSFLEAVKKYQTNNRGDLPDTLLDWSSVAEKYMGSSFIDPDGSRYELVPNTCIEQMMIRSALFAHQIILHWISWTIGYIYIERLLVMARKRSDHLTQGILRYCTDWRVLEFIVRILNILDGLSFTRLTNVDIKNTPCREYF